MQEPEPVVLIAFFRSAVRESYDTVVVWTSSTTTEPGYVDAAGYREGDFSMPRGLFERAARSLFVRTPRVFILRGRLAFGRAAGNRA